MAALKATVVTLAISVTFILSAWAIKEWPWLILVIGGTAVIGYLWKSLYNDYKREEQRKKDEAWRKEHML